RLQQPVLLRTDGLGRLSPEMLVRQRRSHPAAWRAGQEAQLNEERLVDVHDRVRFFARCGGDGLDADRPAAELVYHGQKHLAIDLVQPQLVHLQPFERVGRYYWRDAAVSANLRVVSHALEQPIRNPRWSPPAPGDLMARDLVNRDS